MTFRATNIAEQLDIGPQEDRVKKSQEIGKCWIEPLTALKTRV